MTQAVLDARTARVLPWLVAIAFFMQTLDGTILNTALPAMARDLAEDPLRMQGVVIAYMLTAALLIPASGWVADRFGTRPVFFSAIVLFTLGSLLCAMSTSFNQLVMSRVVQAVGGALMLPVGRLVILRAYPRSEFVRVMTFIALPGMVGPLMGPTLGGWLVQYASWHWIFLINLPVGLIGCIAAFRFMPDLKSAERMRFDTVGFLLFGGAMVLITIALEGLGEMQMPHARVMLLVAIGGASSRPIGCAPVTSTNRCSVRRCSTPAVLPLASLATCSRDWAAGHCRSCCHCCCRSRWATPRRKRA